MNYRAGSILQNDIVVLIEEFENLVKKSELNTMSSDMLHGYLTAIAIGPSIKEPSVWLPTVFFKEKELPEFKDQKLAGRIIDTVFHLYNGLLKAIQSGLFLPYVSYYDENGEEKKDLSSWCGGFALGTYLFGAEWNISNNAELAKLCLPIFFNSGTDSLRKVYSDEQIKHMETIKEESGDLIIDSVYNIRDHFGSYDDFEEPKTHEHTAPNVGRNDSCPCGSGKKYKKCCGN